uniref:autotransporter outer membrane beta-barrel domain-containing protein n=1 Tax=Castellaniella defragrans TaxID=75697 RepID=UPI00333F069B
MAGIASLVPRRLALLIVTLSVGQSLFPASAFGEVLTWSGSADQLQPIPSTIIKKSKGLFPSASLTGNTVKVLIDIPLSGYVFGGVTDGSGEVSGNQVFLSGGGNVSRSIHGGYSNSGGVTGNSIVITDGSVGVSAYGGESNSGDVTGNSVVIPEGSVGENVVGGYSDTGSAIGNTVEIFSANVGRYVQGGLSHEKDAADNRVVISGGRVGWVVYGGYSGFGAATGNTVVISGGEMAQMVVGGYGANRGNAIGNTVEISGGSVNTAVLGGQTIRGAAIGNRVVISGGDLRNGVVGGYSHSGDATGNTVVISGAPQFSATDTALFGGHTGNAKSTGDLFTGNTLSFSARPIVVGAVANFQYYDFTLDPSLANDVNTALITANQVDLGASDGTPSEVRVVGIRSGNVLSGGDKFLLVTATGEMSGNGRGGVQREVAQQGVSLLYDVETKVDVEGKRITAEILSAYEPGINPQLKALSEGRLAGLMLATRGADAVADDLYHTIQMENRDGLVPFILAAGGRSRYDSGSHIDADDFLLTGGLSYRRAGLTAAVFAEGGWGNYDSYNSFAHAASVHGDGNTRYAGGGVFGRYDFASGPYAEASVRLGNTRTSFDTGDLVNIGSGEAARYKLNSRYTSAHVGAGYPWVFNDSSLLDVSVKYLWTHIQGKDAIVAGDPLHFDSLDSQRVRLNGEFRHRYSDSLTLLAGLGYEYEFDARADGTTYGYAIDAPSLKGSTGILSLGATLTPASNRRLSVDLRGQGYVGKREGVGGLLRVNYAF